MAYVAASRLRDMNLELIRMVAPSCIAIELQQLPGPFRWQNWCIGKLDVGVEDYGAARDKADAMMASRLWIMVPDGHPLDGQVYGSERAPPR